MDFGKVTIGAGISLELLSGEAYCLIAVLLIKGSIAMAPAAAVGLGNPYRKVY